MLDDKEKRRQRLRLKKRDRSRQKKRDRKRNDDDFQYNSWMDELPPSRPEWDYDEDQE